MPQQSSSLPFPFPSRQNKTGQQRARFHVQRSSAAYFDQWLVDVVLCDVTRRECALRARCGDETRCCRCEFVERREDKTCNTLQQRMIREELLCTVWVIGKTDAEEVDTRCERVDLGCVDDNFPLVKRKRRRVIRNKFNAIFIFIYSPQRNIIIHFKNYLPVIHNTRTLCSSPKVTTVITPMEKTITITTTSHLCCEEWCSRAARGEVALWWDRTPQDDSPLAQAKNEQYMLKKNQVLKNKELGNIQQHNKHFKKKKKRTKRETKE